MTGRFTFLLLTFLLAFSLRAGAQEGAVDLKIILAVDASGSVNRDEFRLQIEGIAAAIRRPEVAAAVRGGPHGRVLAAVLVWSDAAFPKYPTRWHLLGPPGSFEAFAREVEAFNVQAPGVPAIGGGGTGIGEALAFALEMLADEPTPARRLVVDVSGDGPESKPWKEGAIELPAARASAARAGVTVNGLAIENEYAGLHLWYRARLITGNGSFVMRARDYHDFRRAILEKLLRELSSGALSQAAPRHCDAPAECLARR